MPASRDLSPCAEPSILDALARWRATVEAELKGASFEKKLVTRTLEGVALQPLYTVADLAGVPDLAATPGNAPYLRGVRPLGHKAGGWEIAQRLTAATAEDFNEIILADLMRGQNAVVLNPDTATRSNLDPDEASPADVGSEGVSLTDVADVGTALAGVDVSAVPVHLRAGADAMPLAALYFAALGQAGVAVTAVRGSLTADPLGEWATRGQPVDSLVPLYQSLADWTMWVDANLGDFRSVGVNAAIWTDAGGTAVHELGFALATAAEYLREMGVRGVAPEIAARRMAFSFATGPQFFTEIAKFRAFRPLWTRVVAAFEAPLEAAAGATVDASTARWNKTLLDPHVNLLRTTTEALSAVLGGCDRLHVAPFDEPAGQVSDLSRRLSRNVHALLAEEFGFAATADPAGGSWYLEKLTDQIARAAWALFQDVERRGGMTAVLRSGYAQELVAKAASEKQEAVAKRRLALVGTNLFPNIKETITAPALVDAGARHAKRAKEICARRPRVTAPVPVPSTGARRFEAALVAARSGATIGQLSRLLRGLPVARDRIVPVRPWRAAQGFEALRGAASAFAARTGRRPQVFLAKMGPTLQHKARADFSTGFFAAGGFEVLGKQSFTTAAEAAAAALGSRAPAVVLCSTDETYPTLVPEFAAAMRAGSADTTVVLSGLPADAALVASFREAGIDEFIHLRASVEEVLGGLLHKMGALS